MSHRRKPHVSHWGSSIVHVLYIESLVWAKSTGLLRLHRGNQQLHPRQMAPFYLFNDFKVQWILDILLLYSKNRSGSKLQVLWVTQWESLQATHVYSYSVRAHVAPDWYCLGRAREWEELEELKSEQMQRILARQKLTQCSLEWNPNLKFPLDAVKICIMSSDTFSFLIKSCPATHK